MILIAGPCVIENKDVLRKTIERVLESIHNMTDVEFYFKSSYRKDNRTSFDSFEGLETHEALNMLLEIKKEYNVKLCTDIHNPIDLHLIPELLDVDVIQIPAFLAKQKRLLQIASKFCERNNKILHIKKPQFIGPEDSLNIIKNIELEMNNIFLTDRGTMLGYDKWFMDPRHVPIMKESSAKILADITHPNKNYPGDRIKNIETLGKAYLISGADGVFIETHPNCDGALCDAETMLPTNEFNRIIKELYAISKF